MKSLVSLIVINLTKASKIVDELANIFIKSTFLFPFPLVLR